MKNKTVISLLVTALLVYAAVGLVTSAQELKQAMEMTEALRREIETAEGENRALREELENADGEKDVLSNAEELSGYTSAHEIIFIDKG